MKNVGNTDKILRIIGGIIALGFSFLKLGGLSTATGIVVAIIGAVLIVTAVINFCPAYKLLGIGTANKQ